ncbi:putative transcriptional regulator YvhJ [compost metagenome]
MSIPANRAKKPAPRPPAPSKGRWGMFLLTGCLVSALLGSGTAFGLKQAGFLPEAPTELNLSDLTQVFSRIERTNILIMGADVEYSRRGKVLPTRSDTMLVASLDPTNKRVNLLSVPRDTRVHIPGRHGYDKINAALAYGGAMLAAQTVSDFLQVPIHHWVVVKLDGVENLVDALGGVEIDVERNMSYYDRSAGLRISLKKGPQLLDGAKAHQYIRFRHDAYGDIGRVQRQQRFMQALSQKLLDPMTLTRLPQLLEVAKANIETSMSTPQLFQYANWAKGLTMEAVHMVMVPGEFSGDRYTASFWLPNVDETRRIARSMLTDEGELTVAETPTGGPAVSAKVKRETRITVLNGTGRTGIANEAAQLLRSDGWTVWTVSTHSSSDVTRTRIISQKGDDAVGGAIAYTLGVQAEPVAASLGDIQSDFTVVLGQDFLEALRSPRVSRAPER